MQRYSNTITTAAGRAIVGAQIAVKTTAGTLATIYADDGITTKANPITSGVAGYFEFYAAPGDYSLTISGAGITANVVGVTLAEPQAVVIPAVPPNSAQLVYDASGNVAGIAGPTGKAVNLPDGVLTKLRRRAAIYRSKDPRAVMATPPTVTANGTTLPGFAVTNYNYSASGSIFRTFGAATSLVGGLFRFKNATIAPTGGNLGSGDGAQGSAARIEFMIDASAVAVRVGPTPLPYRFLVDDQYVSLAGTTTIASTGNTTEFITLDFAAAGGRKRRKIAIEMQGNCSMDSVRVGATEKAYQSPGYDLQRLFVLGDSYVYGSGTVNSLADSYAMLLGDYLGMRDTWASGSGGTGWSTVNSAYRFDQRIALDLIPANPDIVVLQGSYNDRDNAAATITANALSALRAIRAALPIVPIFVIGTPPANSGPSVGIIAAENAVFAAVDSFADALTVKIPLSTETLGAWITGTGTTAALAGAGNSDVYTSSDGVHPPPAGHDYLAQRVADAILSKIASR